MTKRVVACVVLVLALVATACGSGSWYTGGGTTTPEPEPPSEAGATSSSSSSTSSATQPQRTYRPPPGSSSRLSGIVVRVIFTDGRQVDADDVKRRLESFGAQVEMFPTSDSGNDPHRGRLYHKSGGDSQGEVIRDAVQDIQPLDLTETGDSSFTDNQDYNLWVVD